MALFQPRLRVSVKGSAVSVTTLSATIVLLAALAMAVMAHRALAEAPNPSPAASQNAPLNWKRIIHLHDGRTFVSDGAIALDATLAKPALSGQNLPEASAQVVERYLSAELSNECAFSQLKRSGENHYAAPSGVMLNAIYVDYLGRTLGKWQLRFRTKGDMDPVVILLDGKPVGLLMPMKSVNP